MSGGKKSNPYRWVILLSIIPIIISTEIMWLSVAPVSSLCEKFYGVSSLSVSYFSMCYLIMFIIFSIPSSYVIDKYGFRTALIIGGSLTAVFGVIRAVFADNFAIALFSQFIIAIGQPFLLNISTKVPANWFPVKERSTATGILTMAQYIGFTVPMLSSPVLADSYGIPGMFRIYAVIAVISAVLVIAFTREKPPVPVDDNGYMEEESQSVLQGLKQLFVNKKFIPVMVIAFIGIGAFNTIMTEIEGILVPSGFTITQAGILGALLTVAGIFGAVVIPYFSDAVGKRKIFCVIATFLAVPLFSVFFFNGSFVIVAIAGAVAGFALMGVTPILFQHGSEVAYPTQEGTSCSVINLMGNISGIVFIFVFEYLGEVTGSLTVPKLFVIAGLTVIFIMYLFMKESKLFIDKYKGLSR